MELTILILLLPFFSFLLLGIGGKWMSHRTAGAIGTLVLGAVAVLSYVTAFQYFSAPRLEDGTFANCKTEETASCNAGSFIAVLG